MGSLELLRPLGRAGLPCVAVSAPGTPPTFSRFASDVVLWTDFWSDQERLIATLLEHAGAEAVAPVLYYEQDSQLLLLARHHARLAGAFRFVLADPELVLDLVDKARFCALAMRHALPVPAARIIRPAEGACESLGLRFPLIIKPLTRSDAWDATGAAGKAVQVADAATLRALWPLFAATRMELLAQEMVPGEETCIESYHVYVDAAGEFAAEFTGRKIRTLPLALGHSTALEITDSGDVTELGRDIIVRIGLRGVAKLDFKRGPDGRLHLLEINPRFNMWHDLAAVAGVNIPLMVYADLTGRPRPATGRARAGARWCSPTKDLLAARAAGIAMRDWLPWMLGCDARSVFSWDDPMPTLRLLPKLLRRQPGGEQTARPAGPLALAEGTAPR